jgi:hypothetical protein
MPKPVKLAGRPRKKPKTAKPHKWWATPAEYHEVVSLATDEGVSVQEYVRREVIPSVKLAAAIAAQTRDYRS